MVRLSRFNKLLGTKMAENGDGEIVTPSSDLSGKWAPSGIFISKC